MGLGWMDEWMGVGKIKGTFTTVPIRSDKGGHQAAGWRSL